MKYTQMMNMEMNIILIINQKMSQVLKSRVDAEYEHGLSSDDRDQKRVTT